MGEGDDGTPPPPVAIGAAPATRRRWIVAAATLTVVGVLGGGTWLASRQDRAGGDSVSGTPAGAADGPRKDPTGSPGIDPTDPIMVADGVASCVVGLRRGEDDSAATGMGPIFHGPNQPALFGAGSADQGAGAGVWHVVTEEQQVEIHVPGVMVADLTGERTQPVSLEGRAAEATAWFTPRWVQVRYFTGVRSPEPCSDDQSFTVTVSGGGEQADRDLAVRIASALLIARSHVVSSGTWPGPGDTGPVAAGGPFDLDPVKGKWVLERVSVDGADVAVVNREGRLGPPALMLFDPSRPWFRGCNSVALALEVQGSVGWIRPSDRRPSSQVRCSGAIGEQEHRILDVFRAGEPLAIRPDDRGRTLTLHDETTTLVFRQG